MKLGVFVHTNPKQYLGALVSAYSMRRASAHADQLRIEVINHADYPFFQRHEGESYLIGGQKRVWRNDDLQSFTPLRFLPPELMGYEGRAVLVDPDVFAAGDIWELLTRDMGGKAIMCRRRPPKKTGPGGWATSVMLLDCAKLQHWRTEADFDELFAFKRDYIDWIELQLEDQDTIGPIEDEWNDFDRLTPATRLVHNTKRQHPALEERPAGRLRHRREVPPVPAQGLAEPWPAAAVRRVRHGRQLRAASGPEPGAVLLRPAQGMPGAGHRHRGDAARRDGQEPRPPRRAGAGGAHAAHSGRRRSARRGRRPEPPGPSRAGDSS